MKSFRQYSGPYVCAHGGHVGAWNYIMAASTVAALPTLVMFFVFQRQLVESIKTSGIK